MYTPQALVNILQETIKLPDEFHYVIQIKGKYQQIGTKEYGNSNGYYYDAINDIEYNTQIKIVVSKSIRALLTNNKVYIFSGVVSKSIKNGLIGFNIQITESPVEQKYEISEKDKRLLSLMEKRGISQNIKPTFVLEEILNKGNKPSIVCVFPLSTETKTEFTAQLGIAGNSYQVVHSSANFGNTNAFKNVLISLDKKYDVVVILRGGGAGLDFFDNLDIVETILSIKTPILLGVGHGDTPVLLRQFVSEWKNNPTDTGNHLREIVERIHRQRTNAESVMHEKVKKLFEDEMKRLSLDKKILAKQQEQLNNQLMEMHKKLKDVECENVKIEKDLLYEKERVFKQKNSLEEKDHQIKSKNNEIKILKDKPTGCFKIIVIIIGSIMITSILVNC